MVRNQGTFQILVSITFETLKSQREEKQKIVISGQLFHIQNFQTC